MYPLIDSHAHISSETVFPAVSEVLKRASDSHIKAIINICTDRPSLNNGMELSAKYPWVYNTGATTPHDVASLGADDFSIFESFAKEGKFVAIGETGLDYYYEHSPKELQKEYLEKYLRLARFCSLPVVIHCREAFQDLFDILDKVYMGSPGVLHCFTGTLEEAKEVVKRGFYLSLSGIVTFKKSVELKEVAKWMPLEKLLIETDAPYLAPEGHRGKMNEPSFLKRVAEEIALLKGIAVEQVAEATATNAKTLFKLC